MQMAVGRLHLMVKVEKRDRKPAPKTVDADRGAEQAYLQAQLHREVEADRERWRRESFPGGWYR